MVYSAFEIVRQALKGYKDIKPQWRKAELQPDYDIIIIGGGGHGLATAFYLASHFQKKRIAVLEKGWIGSGNVGRNTTIIRANYLLHENEAFYEFSLKLWEGLEQALNYNVMVSQRGIVNLYHTDSQRDSYVRRGNAMRLNGADAELLDVTVLRRKYPFLNFDNARFPVRGGLSQARAGTVRHDAVAWGYARAADQLGVDIIENCEVTGFDIVKGRVQGVQSTRGTVQVPQVGLTVAGHSSRLMAMAGQRVPIESHVLQAFVSEGLKPIISNVLTFGAGHFYISQSDKGGLVFGGDLDGYNSYAQRGHLATVEDVCECAMAVMPMLGKARLLRMWGGVVDMSMDGSPIIDKTAIDGLYFNGGWCYGGFKATPASGFAFAHLLARDMPHPTARHYRFDRFRRGLMLDEKGVGAQPNLH